MAEEKVAVTGEKLGDQLPTTFTYNAPGGDRTAVVFMGVSFPPGVEVDLAEVLPKDQAQAAAKKLAGNQFFSGSGVDTEELQRLEQNRAKLAEQAAKQQQEQAQQDARARARAEAGIPDADGPRLETQAAGRTGPRR